jgi:hypothetical protein
VTYVAVGGTSSGAPQLLQVSDSTSIAVSSPCPSGAWYEDVVPDD